MSVYIVTCHDLDMAKIGYSKSPWKRLSMLRTGSPAKLELSAVIPGGKKQEKQLQNEYNDDWSHGEWFNISERLKCLIRQFRVEVKPYRERRPFHEANDKTSDGRPTINALCASSDITRSYASMILTDKRKPARPLAIKIYRATGWKHDSIAALTDDQIAMLENIDGLAA